MRLKSRVSNSFLTEGKEYEIFVGATSSYIFDDTQNWNQYWSLFDFVPCSFFKPIDMRMPGHTVELEYFEIKPQANRHENNEEATEAARQLSATLELLTSKILGDDVHTGRLGEVIHRARLALDKLDEIQKSAVK